MVPFISFEHAINTLVDKGVVSSEEAVKLNDYNEKRKIAVRVDEFTYDLELLSAEETDPTKRAKIQTIDKNAA